MNAVILAAGYATRLRPLTETLAKPLLPIARRPILDRLLDNLARVPGLRTAHIVTNHRFFDAFERWAEKRARPPRVVVLDDRTENEADRLGALGDLHWTVQRAGLAGDDLLVLAGDNLFDFELADFAAFHREKGDGSAIAVHVCDDLALVRQYSEVTLGPDDRVVSFVEKPSEPASPLVGIGVYAYRPEHVALLPTYFAEGGARDQPGHFVAWLHRRATVYGFRTSGAWLDIGTPAQLLEADNDVRAREGLPLRAAYSVEG